MKTGEIIGSIRSILKQQSDDSPYSDQFLYNELITSRSKILGEKYGNLSEVPYMNWQTLTVKLKKEKYVDCGCVASGCDILRSELIIPGVAVSYMKRPFIKVRLFSGQELPYVKPERQRTNVYSETLGDKPAYYIQNNRLIVWNITSLKAIQIEGVFSNPLDLSDFDICDENGNTFGKSCFNIDSMNFPCDADIIDTAKILVVQKLIPSFQIADDKKNDSEI